jgi:hypothetical protein
LDLQRNPVHHPRESRSLFAGEHTVAKLANTNKPSEILVENLESTAILFGLAGVTEATGSVEDLGERVKVN